MLHHVSGGEGSRVQEMVRFMNTEGFRYGHAHCYHMVLGPNSNTFVQWFLDHFPEHGWRLPFAAWGRGYQHEKKLGNEEVE